MVMEYSGFHSNLESEKKNKILKCISAFTGYMKKIVLELQNESVNLHQEKHSVFLGLKAQWIQLVLRENEMLEAFKDFTDVGILSFVCIFEIMQLKKASC